jgi:hypothetical protein
LKYILPERKLSEKTKKAKSENSRVQGEDDAEETGRKKTYTGGLSTQYAIFPC